jgi:flagellar hook assembly protein FlgD
MPSSDLRRFTVVLGRRLVVVLASASMVLASFGVASAHEEVADSKVTIGESKKGVKGKVTSGAAFCSALRQVKVFKVKSGKDKKVGSATTNLKGKWSVKVPNANGKYYVKVARTLDDHDPYSHVHECTAAKSDKLKI